MKNSKNKENAQNKAPRKEEKVGLSVNDLPEIAVLNQEIERFKKTMLKNLTHEDEESTRAVAERHFLNGLERAKEVLIRSYGSHNDEGGENLSGDRE